MLRFFTSVGSEVLLELHISPRRPFLYGSHEYAVEVSIADVWVAS